MLDDWTLVICKKGYMDSPEIQQELKKHPTLKYPYLGRFIPGWTILLCCPGDNSKEHCEKVERQTPDWLFHEFLHYILYWDISQEACEKLDSDFMKKYEDYWKD